jgi:type IV fimbrial biogenesis protein FimT
MRQSASGGSRLVHRQAAYTLVELLVVVALAAIVASLAIPSMSSLLNSQRSSSLAYAFLNSLSLARSEAIKRNARVALCKSANGLSCTHLGGWEQGWIVFHDANNNATLDQGEDIIELRGAVTAGLKLTGNTTVANYVSYSPSGSAKLISGAFQAGTFTLCLEPVSEPDVRQVILSSTGRARSVRGLASDCS